MKKSFCVLLLMLASIEPLAKPINPYQLLVSPNAGMGLVG